MPLDPQRPGFYKTIQCRYFNDDGRALEPYCRMGSRCNYIHPEDSQWERRKNHKRKPLPSPEKPTASARRRSSVSSVIPTAEYSRPPHRDDGLSSSRRDFEERRGRSLERKPMDIDRSQSRDRGHYERPATADPDVHAAVKAVSYSAYKDRDVGNPRTPRRPSLPPSTHAAQPRPETRLIPTAPAIQARAILPLPSAVNTSSTQEKTTESFKTIAAITNQFILDNAVCDKEQEKVETYNNLSSTLAKVSPASVAAIAPTLASVISSHSKQREKVQADLKRLADVWEDMLADFVQNAQKSIDARMDSAVSRIREEADREIARIKAAAMDAEIRPPSNTLPKRKHEDGSRLWGDRSSYRADFPRDSSRYEHESDRSPENKRARLGDPVYSESSRGQPSGSDYRNGQTDNQQLFSSRTPIHHGFSAHQASGPSNIHQTNHSSVATMGTNTDRDIHSKDQSSIASSNGNNFGSNTGNTGQYRSD